MAPLISALLDAIFGSLVEATGLSDRLRQLLGREPERLAFGAALTQALTDVANEFPGRDLRYFTEMLPQFAGPLLARYLQPAAPLPTADELTHLWLNHLTIDSAIVYRQEFVTFATHFLDRLADHLENQGPLQWIVQARRQRSSEETIQRMAEAMEQNAAGVEALQEELAELIAALETTLMASGHPAVYTSGGAYVGSDVSAQNFAGRDLTIRNYFVQGLARLPVDYSVRIENFLFTYLGGRDERVPFGGRSQQLDELNDWVDDPTAPPYYLMVAEAGKGKSALVSRWSTQLATRPELDVIFIPISIRFQTAAQDVFFAALAARLAQIHETQSLESFHKPTSAEEWKAICESYLRRPLPTGKRLVVILDGLDEATDWAAGPELFAVRPPVGLRVLVTARLRARETDALGWAVTLQWEGPQLARKVALPALDQQGVAEALSSMGNPLQWLAPQIDIAGKLYQLSQGDPLLVQLYVRELAQAQQEAGFLTPNDLDTIEPGLDGFMQKWWDDQRKQWCMQQKDPTVEEKQLLPLLSACAVAVGPLLLSDLAALDGTRFGVTRIVANQAELLGRWLIGDGVDQGYIFAHPRLREFFAGPTWLSADEYAAWQAKFCDWGRRVLIDLKRGNLRPNEVPSYLLRHYATHLTQSGAAPHHFYALMSDGWRRAWEALDVSMNMTILLHYVPLRFGFPM